MFKKRASIAVAVVALAILAPAAAAHADTYIDAGTKSCTGSSHVYTKGTASGNHYHTHYGPNVNFERSFGGNPLLSKTTYYYSGGQGSFHGFVSAEAFGNVTAASIACDV